MLRIDGRGVDEVVALASESPIHLLAAFACRGMQLKDQHTSVQQRLYMHLLMVHLDSDAEITTHSLLELFVWHCVGSWLSKLGLNMYDTATFRRSDLPTIGFSSDMRELALRCVRDAIDLFSIVVPLPFHTYSSTLLSFI